MADTIYKYLEKDGRFKQFIRMISNADSLATTLDGKGSFTVFAPIDTAFTNEKLGAGVLESWSNDGDILLDKVRLHLVYNEHSSEELKTAAKDGKTFNDADNNPFNLSEKDGDLWVGHGNKQVKISQADIKTSNGVIHIIEDLLSV